MSAQLVGFKGKVYKMPVLTSFRKNFRFPDFPFPSLPPLCRLSSRKETCGSLAEADKNWVELKVAMLADACSCDFRWKEGSLLDYQPM
ncbi:MAG: hypothetical protein ACKESB_00625 [Candidatus Hodgkinia cicadicola]